MNAFYSVWFVCVVYDVCANAKYKIMLNSIYLVRQSIHELLFSCFETESVASLFGLHR